MSRLVLMVLVTAGLIACEEPPPRGPGEWSYQNGYAQTTAEASGQQTTYANGYAQQTAAPAPSVTYTPLAQPQQQSIQTQAQPQTAATQIQTTPVPLGVQTLTPPAPTSTAASPVIQMAVPGAGAFGCSTDAQCMLGRCNTSYGRCAYPCKTSEIDCKPGNVCTPSGVCLPRAAGGVSM